MTDERVQTASLLSAAGSVTADCDAATRSELVTTEHVARDCLGGSRTGRRKTLSIFGKKIPRKGLGSRQELRRRDPCYAQRAYLGLVIGGAGGYDGCNL